MERIGDGKDNFVYEEIAKAYHPCNDVRVIWICEHVVQASREVGARLFMFRHFPTLLNVAREIVVAVVNMWSGVSMIVIVSSFLSHVYYFVGLAMQCQRRDHGLRE